MNVNAKVRKARRELEIWNFKAKAVTLGWVLTVMIVGAIIGAAIVWDAAILCLLFIVIFAVGFLAYFSFSDADGVYIYRRQAKWRYEDVQDEFAEDITRADKMNF